LLPSWLKTRVIVDLDDLEHRKLRRELALAKFHRKMLFDYLEFLKLRRLECNLPEASGEFVVCSETDRRILDPGAKARVVPNGVDIPPCMDDVDDNSSSPVLLFVGSMAYPPNVDAVQFFTREILPLVRREVPAARFMIVGRDPSPAVWRLHDNTTVVVTGTVPDVEPYLRQATVVVAPIRVGGGTRVKILEAMAHQRPVVATSIGAEGLEVESESHLLIANSAPAFAHACMQLLRDQNNRRVLARRAYELVRAKYDWSKIERKVAQIALQDTVARPVQPEEGLCQQL
jgi:glycosyltransferase involved in cell wall biosynthesis